MYLIWANFNQPLTPALATGVVVTSRSIILTTVCITAITCGVRNGMSIVICSYATIYIISAAPLIMSVLYPTKKFIGNTPFIIFDMIYSFNQFNLSHLLLC